MKLREIWRFLVNLLKKYRWFILTVVWTALQIIIYQTCKSWIPYLIIFILCFCFYVVIRIIYFRKNSINFLRKYGWPIAITILVIIFLTPFIMVHYGMNPNDFFKFGFSDLKDFFTLWISSCGVAGLVVNIIHSQTRIRLQDKLIQQQEKQRRDNRFAKSVELLGHESGSTRIGGVYNLYFLAVEFFDEYGYYAISILSSHIRVITTTQDYQNKYKEATSDEIQSILDVLTRFSYPEESKDCLDKILSMLNTLIKSLLNKGFRINLANSHLAGANLMSADLRDVNLRGVNLLEADLLNADLTNACLEEAYLERVCFNRANLKKTNLQRANLKEANLKEANLQEANLQGANLQGANLTGANLQEAYMDEANLVGANLKGANLQKAGLKDASLEGADLEKANLQEVFLSNGNLKRVNLQEANLEKVHLQEANLEEANLERVHLQGVYLEGGDWERVHLQGAYLERVFLHKVNLKGANLKGANLERVDLLDANLEGANLEGAYLQGVFLQGANLTGANLTGANLEKTYLIGANLNGVNFEGTILKGAYVSEEQEELIIAAGGIFED